MTGAGINDDDMLVVDRSLRPNNNSIVVAVIDGEVTVKALDMSSEEIWLRSKNPDYNPFKDFSNGHKGWSAIHFQFTKRIQQKKGKRQHIAGTFLCFRDVYTGLPATLM